MCLQHMDCPEAKSDFRLSSHLKPSYIDICLFSAVKVCVCPCRTLGDVDNDAEWQHYSDI